MQDIEIWWNRSFWNLNASKIQKLIVWPEYICNYFLVFDMASYWHHEFDPFSQHDHIVYIFNGFHTCERMSEWETKKVFQI